ncbi:MAG: AMP-binding protein [Roseburia sp.]|nr:AMP-binding protein [Roseburia sp.]
MNYYDLNKEWNSNSDYIICYTSGSTGKPSKIKIPKTQLLASAQRTNKIFNIKSSSLLYSCISPDYIGGKMMLIRSLIAGCKFLFEKPSNTPLSQIDRNIKINLLSIVPSQMNYILDNIHKLPEIKNILIGGAPIPQNLKIKIAQSGLHVFESYGMTETASHIALREVKGQDTPFRTLEDIFVENEDGRLKITIPGWDTFLTNDSPQIINPKEFHILGRVDNIINSGGIKINPELLESKLSNYLSIPYAFTSIPDEKWGEALALVYESNGTTKQQISNIVNNSLYGYENPKHIIPIDKMPYTPNGKLQRKKLKEYGIEFIKTPFHKNSAIK